jgi:outer membrane protein TolC
MSLYELRAFAENLASDVENACWDYVLAQRRIEIVESSMKLAEDQLAETRERIRVGKLAAVELYAADAEAALRREDLINARSALDLARIQLQRLLNLPVEDRWDHEILIADQPAAPDENLDDAATHVAVALKWRPEINQARLEIQRGNLEIVKTRNGLLPVMDFFIRMGRSGYAASFGDAARDPVKDGYDVSGGIVLEYPFFNRAAGAGHERAELGLRRSEEALGNLSQLVEVDVRSALIEVRRAGEQVSATAATRRLQEKTLKAETEKFRVGKSTALLVAGAQRDFVSSRISEVEAVISHLKAQVALYRLEGTLLERRGIAAPSQG